MLVCMEAEAEMTQVYPSKDDSESIVLYKYISSEALAGFLVNCDLKLSFAHDSNDPFELLNSQDHPDERGEFATMGFLSLTTNNNSPAMWGNYASRYQGACLKFEIPYSSAKDRRDDNSYSWYFTEWSKKLKAAGVGDFLYRRWYEDDEKRLVIYYGGGDVLLHCLYSDKRPNFSHRAQLFYERFNNEFEEYKIAASFQRIAAKHISWQNEDEYRLVYMKSLATRVASINGGLMYFVNDISPCLKEVILGPHCKIARSDVEMALKKNLEKMTGNSVMCTRAQFVGGSYLLKISHNF